MRRDLRSGCGTRRGRLLNPHQYHKGVAHAVSRYHLLSQCGIQPGPRDDTRGGGPGEGAYILFSGANRVGIGVGVEQTRRA
jgi:hypothetical protein